MPRLQPVDWRTLETVFVAAGFRFVRQKGSHRSYVKEGVARPVFIICNNLKTASPSREEYFRLLEVGR